MWAGAAPQGWSSGVVLRVSPLSSLILYTTLYFRMLSSRPGVSSASGGSEMLGSHQGSWVWLPLRWGGGRANPASGLPAGWGETQAGATRGVNGASAYRHWGLWVKRGHVGVPCTPAQAPHLEVALPAG